MYSLSQLSLDRCAWGKEVGLAHRGFALRATVLVTYCVSQLLMSPDTQPKTALVEALQVGLPAVRTIRCSQESPGSPWEHSKTFHAVVP